LVKIYKIMCWFLVLHGALEGGPDRPRPTPQNLVVMSVVCLGYFLNSVVMALFISWTSPRAAALAHSKILVRRPFPCAPLRFASCLSDCLLVRLDCYIASNEGSRRIAQRI